MSNDAAQINQLRLALGKADAIFSSSSTHDLMQRQLGEVWDRAMILQGGDKTRATAFLLSPNPVMEGKRPFDVAVSGEAGYEVVQTFIGRIEHGIYA